jgi:hypothetical protein
MPKQKRNPASCVITDADSSLLEVANELRAQDSAALRVYPFIAIYTNKHQARRYVQSLKKSIALARQPKFV